MKLFKILINKILGTLNYQIIKGKKSEFPIEAEPEIIKIINICNQFSMTGKKRIYLLSQAIMNSKISNLDGDFVECGVWRGGGI
jgi:O-methyltransferase